MPAARTLLSGLRALWLPHLRGDGRDELGNATPVDPHGGVTWETDGARFHPETQSYLEHAHPAKGALLPDECVSIAFAATVHSVVGISPLFARWGSNLQEYQVQVSAGGTLAGAVVEAGTNSVKFTTGLTWTQGVRHFGVFAWDGAHLFAQVDGGAWTQGDACAKFKADFSEAIRLGTDGTNYANATLHWMGYWIRHQAILAPSEIAALWAREQALRGGAGGSILWAPPGRMRGSRLFDVTRTLERAAPDNTSAALTAHYRLGGQRRLVHQATLDVADFLRNDTGYLSETDGLTLVPGSAFAEPTTQANYSGVGAFQGHGQMCFDPTPIPQSADGQLVQVWLRQILMPTGHPPQPEGQVENWVYWRASDDGGKTWARSAQLKYQAGGDFNPADPLNQAYILANQADIGAIIRLSDGRLFAPVGHTNDPTDVTNDTRTGERMGGRVCVLTADGAGGYTQAWSNSVSALAIASTRGIFEPGSVELPPANDGSLRVLVTWRISNQGALVPVTCAKYYSVATVHLDGSISLTAPALLNFSDGGWAPSGSSFHGWTTLADGTRVLLVALATETNAGGNTPRQDLDAVALDPETLGLIRETVTTLDDEDILTESADDPTNWTAVLQYLGQTLQVYGTRLGEHIPGVGNSYRWDCVPTADAVNVLSVPDATADRATLWRGALIWNRVRARWEPAAGADLGDYSVGLTPDGAGNAKGNLPVGLGAGPVTIQPYTLAGLWPAAGDTALAAQSAAVTLPDPPKASASVSAAPAGTAEVG